LIALVLSACAYDAGPGESVGATRAALGEPVDGFPNWHERVVHVWTNRARADPAADLASCGATCAERACYGPVAPLAWGHDLARLARFHSENLSRMGCSLMHDSPCTLATDIGTQYTPGPCNGDPSCACSAGGAACGGTGSTIIWDRFSRFGVTGGARAENIASTGTDPVSTFYLWLHEPDSNPACGWRIANGHRHSILNGSYRSLGAGRSDVSPRRFTQDFHSAGSPSGLVAGVHYPETGASVEMRANWYDSSVPSTAQVNVDGTCTAMTVERGLTNNGTFLTSVSGVGSGCHRYYFHFEVGSTDYFYPTTGAFGIGCATDWDPTRPPVCGACTPACGGRACGDDGCGGSCGSCGAGETCTAGACVAACTPDCAGRACGDDGCGGSCGVCASGRMCDAAGACVCATGRTDCGGSCVRTNTNRNHCGGCGIACGATEACTSGVCVCTPDCSGRACGDDGCGGSCGTCAGGRVCGAGGACACSGGLTDCGGSCVDVRVDIANCGACGTSCAAGERCAAGTCAADTPDAGCVPACDGRTCGDDTCGGSCGMCASGEVCAGGGACACAGGATDCGGACVDTRADAMHCGACDAVCAATEVCLAAACVGSGDDAGMPDGGVPGDGGVPPPAMDDGGTSTGGPTPLTDDERLVTGSCGCTTPGMARRTQLLPALALLLFVPLALRRRRA